MMMMDMIMIMMEMMIMMMRITTTQQWLHPSDAGGTKRRGGQCQAARCQHVPHGDPGGAPHSQQDKMMSKMGFVMISGKNAKNVSKYGLLPHDLKHGNIGFKKSSKQGE